MRDMREMVGILLAVAFLTPQRQTAPSYLPIDTEVVKKSIVFLYYTRGQDKFEVGTGFLIAIPVKGDPTHSHVAIVTARHLVDPQWAGCPWSNPSVLTVRVNTKNYSPGISESGIWEGSVNLEASGQRVWLTHADQRVDVAVIQVDAKLAQIIDKDVKLLAISDFSTKEEIERFHIGIGANIISAGLVPELLDVKRNYPAFKFGKISNVLDEPVKLRCGTGPPKDRLSWIIAGNFVPGNSGSPVFLMPLEFALGPPFQFNGPRNMILGLVSGNIEGADLGEMVPIEYAFDVIAKYYPDADLYRGADKDKPLNK